MPNDRIEAYLAKQDCQELAYRYMRGLDRLDRDAIVDVFWEDGWCEYGFYNGPPAPFADFAMSALAGHVANHHMVGQILIDVQGDEAFGEVYFQAYHKVPNEAGEHDDLIIAGRYLDRYECRGGVWKMTYRAEHNDWARTTPTADVYFEAAPDCLRGARQDDAVYDVERRRRH